MNMLVENSSTRVSALRFHLPGFFRPDLSVAWNLQIRPGWPARKPQEATWIFHVKKKVGNCLFVCLFLFTWLLETQTRVFMLA